jgi:hypothetical protein
VWGLIFHIMPWIGLDLLEMARAVAAFDVVPVRLNSCAQGTGTLQHIRRRGLKKIAELSDTRQFRAAVERPLRGAQDRAAAEGLETALAEPNSRA